MTTTTPREDETVAAVATCTPEASDVEQDTTTATCQEHAEDTERTEDDDASTSDIPEEFICPLTLEIFTDPLMDKRGMNWERSAILEWLNRGNTTCPLTREPMSFRSLIPNVNLRTRVEHWKRDNGYEIGSNAKKPWEREYVVAYIEAPPGSTLERQYTQTYAQARAAAIARRMERREAAARQQQQPAQESSTNEESRRSSRGRRRRLSLTRPTGYSPATQQRRLAGLLGEALSIVRRPPLASAED